MTNAHDENRLLLQPVVTTGVFSDVPIVNSSADEDDAGDFLEQNNPTQRKKVLALRRRHQIHRGARRITRMVVCALSVLCVFIMLYLPLYTNVQTRHVALADWGYNSSRNIADYVLPDNDTTLLEPRQICQNKIFVLIVVCSSLHNFAARQTIRETWGNTTEFNYAMFVKLHAHLSEHFLMPTKKRLNYYSEFLTANQNKTFSTTTNSVKSIPVRIVFLIGRSKDETGNETLARIHTEAEQYNDIVQQNFIDSYNNLTLKSVMALKWVTRRCLKQCAFFMKCDDDTFINVPNLLHFLLGGTVPIYNDTLDFYDAHTYQALAPNSRLNITSNYLAGHLFCAARPIANVSSKWYMPYYMYPAEKYPFYLSGAGYLMSMDVVPRLYESAFNTSFVYLEDVYITGLCANKMHLKRRHHPLFGYTRSMDLCSFKGVITQHDLKDDSMAEAYAFVANISNRCPPPGKYFKRIRLRKNSSCI